MERAPCQHWMATSFGVIFMLAACSSSSSGSSTKCANVCACVSENYGPSGASQCNQECRESFSKDECTSKLQTSGAGRCLDACSAFPDGTSGTSGSSGASGSSGTSGDPPGPSCTTTSTGCTCTVGNTPSTSSCSTTESGGGVCCAGEDWPRSGACGCQQSYCCALKNGCACYNGAGTCAEQGGTTISKCGDAAPNTCSGGLTKVSRCK